MEYNRVSKEIFEPVKENKKIFEENFKDKLSEIFPSCVKDGQVDFKALIEELGKYVDTKERYELTWAGKQNAKKKANEDIVGRTLKYIPEDSKNPEATENLYIEGDNLEVLKLLRYSYYNKIKVIYIDPPYNTGNDFVYNDNFVQEKTDSDKSEGDVGEDNEKFIINQKSSNRFHANWLNMIYPRLKIAKDLLSEDGIIIISIDENEHNNLKLLCDDILDEQNFAGEIIWKNSTKNDQAYISMQHEYILFYVRNKEINKGEWQEKKEGLDEIFKAFEGFRKECGTDWAAIHKKALAWYKQFPESNPISNSKHYTWYDDIKGVYFPDNISGPNDGQYVYDIIHPITGKAVKIPSRGWFCPEESMKIKIKEGKIHFGKDETTVPCLKTYLKNTQYQSLTSIKFKDGRIASKNLRNLLGGKYFSNPKDPELLANILKSIGFQSDDIILDFFSGSSTSAESVIQLNAEDGGKRKFIMVQIPETVNEKDNKESYDFLKALKKPFNICEIGKERIRRAGEKILAENKDKEGIENLDVGFKVFKTADTNIRWFSEAMKGSLTPLEETTNDKDKLDFNDGFTDIDVVYEILLRHRDIPLSSKVENLREIGKRTYMFADVVVVCLETEITEEIVDKIAAIEPMPIKIIFRDSAFGDNISLKENTMIRLEAQIKKNSGIMKKSYRIEFI